VLPNGVETSHELGFAELIRRTSQYGEPSRVGMEGTGSYGAGYLRRSVEMASATGYCMKCKAQRGIRDAKPITMKNGRPATKGYCEVCATKILKIGAAK
jgi:hypothetical protein